MRALLLLLLCGCLPPGDYHCAHGEGVSFAPGVEEINICPKVDQIHARAEKLCSRVGADISRIQIRVMGSDFPCGDRIVAGCATWPNGVYVSTPVVLPDEIGHLVWWSCFNRSGETYPGGVITYDPDFKAFVDSLQ